MTYVLVQREAIGRPGLPAPGRYERVWLCNRPGCGWWGSNGPMPHHDTNGGGRHMADYTYETSCDVRATVFARYRDYPVITRRRKR